MTDFSAAASVLAPHPAWQDAIAFAARRHAGQSRRDKKTPYVSHVFRVAMTVSDCFGCHDEAALCAAVLHDTIEDTGTDFDDIEDRFGIETAHLVAALTKNMILREPEREVDYDDRLAKADWRARLVKLADVYDNLHDLPNSKPKAGALERMTSRCARAITLAEPDLERLTGENREIVSRAVELVRAAVQAKIE